MVSRFALRLPHWLALQTKMPPYVRSELSPKNMLYSAPFGWHTWRYWCHRFIEALVLEYIFAWRAWITVAEFLCCMQMGNSSEYRLGERNTRATATISVCVFVLHIFHFIIQPEHQTKINWFLTRVEWLKYTHTKKKIDKCSTTKMKYEKFVSKRCALRSLHRRSLRFNYTYSTRRQLFLLFATSPRSRTWLIC